MSVGASAHAAMRIPLWVWCWLAVVGAALMLRPLLPVDETRYLAVAWEMWRDGNLLVPHLNGEPYSHKPPLLFWLIHLGWAAVGVNEWTARLVAPLAGLGTAWLAGRLARALWPDDARAAALAPMLLVGAVFFTLFTTLTMFDLLLALFALGGLLATVAAARAATPPRRLAAFALAGTAMGLGVLAKGPAILLHVLPAMILAPLWATRIGSAAQAPRWSAWYAGIALSVAIAAAVGLAWAVPAALAGGGEFAHAIFIGQSAGRMVESFAHARPWWWYLALLAPLALPWPIWPRLWRATGAAWRDAIADGGVRFALAWFVPAFIAFSAISGKQLHYLLPDFPALALIAAFLLSRGDRVDDDSNAARRDRMLPALAAIMIGIAGAAALWLPMGKRLATALAGAEPGWLTLLAFGGAAILLSRRCWPAGVFGRAAALACLPLLAVIAVHLAARPLLESRHDLGPLAARLAAWEKAGEAIGHIGKYHGQFHFLGRLKRPIAPLGLVNDDIPAWLARNPKGKVISYRDKGPPTGTVEPVLVAPYQRGWLVVWDRDQLAADPDVADRD